MSALAKTQQDAPPPPAKAARVLEVAVDAPELVSGLVVRASHLVEAVGEKPDPTEITESQSVRVDCGSRTSLEVSIEWKWSDRPGQHAAEGAQVVAGHDAGMAANRAAWQQDLSEKYLAPRMRAAMERGLLRGCIAEDGTSVLAEWRPTAFFCRTCESCDGDGHLECGTCGTVGTLPCNSLSCRWGRTTCSSCGGRGKQQYSNGSWNNCHGCYGSGEQACLHCGGSTRIRCNPCGGHGYFTCNPCQKTGKITQMHGFEMKMAHRTQFWHGSIADGESLEAWIKEGSKGHLDVEPSGSQPVMRFSQARLTIAREPDKTPTFRYLVEGSVVQGQVAAKTAGFEWVGWCTHLDSKRFGFLPFLDERARKLAADLDETAKGVSPSAFREAVSGLGGLGTILKDAQREGKAAADTARSVFDFFRGSVSEGAASSLARAQQTCISRFGDTAARAGWKWPARMLVAAAALPFLMDVPWATYSDRDFAPAAVAAIGMAIVIAAIAFAAEAMGRRAVRMEVGSSKLFKPNVAGRRAAGLAVLLVAFGIMSPRIGLEAAPFRAAAHEIREIVGLPHLGCVQPRAELVAAGCSIGR